MEFIWNFISLTLRRKKKPPTKWGALAVGYCGIGVPWQWGALAVGYPDSGIP